MIKNIAKLTITLLLCQATPSFANNPHTSPTVTHEAHNLILIGPPASGKGTQAATLSQRLHIPTISTGDLLRAQAQLETPEALALKETMASGQLVSDEIVLNLLKARLANPDAQQGFILDGFPRTVEQAQSLDSMGINIHHVIVLEVPDQEIIKRISGRRIHPASGRNYHTETNPPKVEGKDDITGEPLTQRDDDTVEAVTKRLASFRAQTVPVIDFYKRKASQEQEHLHVIVIDSTQPIKKVQKAIFLALEQ